MSRNFCTPQCADSCCVGQTKKKQFKNKFSSKDRQTEISFPSACEAIRVVFFVIRNHNYI